MTYDPRQTFSAQQASYGRASGVTSSRSNANKQAANSMRSGGGGRNMSGIGSRSKPKPKPPTFMERFTSLFKRSGGNTSPRPKPRPDPAKLYSSNKFKGPSVTIPDTSKFMSPMERRRLEMAEQAARDRGTAGFRVYDYGTNPDNTNFVRPMPRPFFGGPSDPDPKKDRPSLGSPSAELRTTGVDEDMKDAINRSIAQAQSAAKIHTVKKGDTLTKLAKENNTTIKAIVEANGIEDPDLIKINETLIIPPKPATGIMSRPNTYADNEDPDSQFYQSGVPLDQREYAPEGEPFVLPEMTPPLNPPGNNIDFDFIAEQEGAAINEGYVPTRRDGTVVGNSGVTVGTGVDLGSKNDTYFEGLDESIKAKLRPHFGKKRTVAQTSLESNPLNLTDSEVATLDRFVKEKELDTLRNRWNEDSDTDFDDLPTNQATAVASTYYQYGQQMFDHNYWDQTTSGDWEAAVENLRDYGDDYNSRRNREANYLESGEM